MVKHGKSCPNIVYFHKNKVLNIFGQKRLGKLIESNDYVCTQKEGGGLGANSRNFFMSLSLVYRSNFISNEQISQNYEYIVQELKLDIEIVR